MEESKLSFEAIEVAKQIYSEISPVRRNDKYDQIHEAKFIEQVGPIIEAIIQDHEKGRLSAQKRCIEEVSFLADEQAAHTRTKAILDTKEVEINELTKAIRDDQDYHAEEVKQFNDGYNAYKEGKPDTAQPHYETDHSEWLIGYAFGAYDDLKKRVSAGEVLIAELRSHKFHLPGVLQLINNYDDAIKKIEDSYGRDENQSL